MVTLCHTRSCASPGTSLSSWKENLATPFLSVEIQLGDDLSHPMSKFPWCLELKIGICYLWDSYLYKSSFPNSRVLQHYSAVSKTPVGLEHKDMDLKGNAHLPKGHPTTQWSTANYDSQPMAFAPWCLLGPCVILHTVGYYSPSSGCSVDHSLIPMIHSLSSDP